GEPLAPHPLRALCPSRHRARGRGLATAPARHARADHSMGGRMIGAERSRVMRVAVIAAVVVVLDQIVKVIALDRLAPGIPVDVVPGLIALTLVRNPGLAFGLLAGIPAGWRWGVGLLSLLRPG